jgi:hypothetical protein
MANKPKQTSSTNSLTQSGQSSKLKIKPFEINKLDIPPHLISMIGKKPTGKSWIIKEILYYNNPINTIVTKTNTEPTLEELENLIKIHLHL